MSAHDDAVLDIYEAEAMVWIDYLRAQLAAAEERVKELEGVSYYAALCGARQEIDSLSAKLAAAEERLKELKEAFRPYASAQGWVCFQDGTWVDCVARFRRLLGIEVEP